MSMNNRKNSLYNPKFKQEKSKEVEKVEEIKVEETNEAITKNIVEDVVLEEVTEENKAKDTVVDLVEDEQINKEMQLISEQISNGEIVVESIENKEENSKREEFNDEQIAELNHAMNENEKQKEDVVELTNEVVVEQKQKPHYNIVKNPITNSIDVVSPKKTQKEEVSIMSLEKIDVAQKMLEQMNSDILKYELEVEIHKNMIFSESLHSVKSELQSKLNVFQKNLDYLKKKKIELDLIISKI